MFILIKINVFKKISNCQLRHICDHDYNDFFYLINENNIKNITGHIINTKPDYDLIIQIKNNSFTHQIDKTSLKLEKDYDLNNTNRIIYVNLHEINKSNKYLFDLKDIKYIYMLRVNLDFSKNMIKNHIKVKWLKRSSQYIKTFFSKNDNVRIDDYIEPKKRYFTNGMKPMIYNKKPKGKYKLDYAIFYSKGNDWLQSHLVNLNNFSIIPKRTSFIIKYQLDKTNFYFIDDIKSLKEFEKKFMLINSFEIHQSTSTDAHMTRMHYHGYGGESINYIDWIKFSKKYDGIEISHEFVKNYFNDSKKAINSLWIDTFDVNGGVVFNKKAIKEKEVIFFTHDGNWYEHI